MNRIERLFEDGAIRFVLSITVLLLLIEQIEWDGDPYMGWDMILSRGLICTLAVWLMRKLSILHGAGFQQAGWGKGLLWGTPLLLLGAVSAVYSNLGMNLQAIEAPGAGRTLLFTASMLSVALAEEFGFRGLLLNLMMRKYGTDERGVSRAILLSALIFGAAHLLGIFVSPPVTVLVQAVNAASAGVLFSVIYIRCRTIWAVVTVHFLVDWMALFPQQCLTGTTSIIAGELSAAQGILVVVVGSVLPLVVSFIQFKRVNFSVSDGMR